MKKLNAWFRLIRKEVTFRKLAKAAMEVRGT